MSLIDIDAAIDATPAFKNSVQINYLNRYLIEALVQELASAHGAAARSNSKVRRALESAAKGTSQGQWPRRIGIKPGTPLSNALLAVAGRIGQGQPGRKPKTAAAKRLHDTLTTMRRAGPDGDDAARLLTLPGQAGRPGSRGTHNLDLTNSETARLVAKHATAWGIDNNGAVDVINAARLALYDALRTQFGAVAAREALDNAHRTRRRKT